MKTTTVLLVLADGFEEIEALGTADVLNRLGIRVLLTGLNGTAVEGAHHIKVTADTTLDAAPFSSSAAIILPGGLPGATNLRDSETLAERLREFVHAEKPVAAICAAPIVLKTAGIAEGKRLTGYPGSERLSGAADLVFNGKTVEHDGKIITGKGPGAFIPFAAEIARALDVPEDAIKTVLDGMFASE